MTHDELVKRAIRWLKNKRCSVIAAELVTHTRSRETPDVIGWYGGGNGSILIECKISKSDFRADMKKPARNGGPAMGNWRFYFTPPGLLDGLKLPYGWGLYEVHPNSVRHVRGVRYDGRNPPFTDIYEPFTGTCKHSESAMLLSIIRRQNNWDCVTVGLKEREAE
jgi:hypothetical protein